MVSYDQKTIYSKPKRSFACHLYRACLSCLFLSCFSHARCRLQFMHLCLYITIMVIPEGSMNVLGSYLTGRDVLILSIMPMEGSILAYMVLIIAITTISQLEGLAGYTPVRTLFYSRQNKIKI